ncbi:nitronate monooxygenase [Mucilaginibacter roseus]|uniref:Nitronate monooxygenase n=2 Tax=Mucilaginibacter roseus TaxID=1528868 RepID=A0ABS8TYX6_9SPHI|nr:nitronate monooxygenase [Mucilaginibacter roseus]
MTDARLVAEVSEAGGLGILGPHAGQTTNPKSNEEVIGRMRTEIRKVQSLTDKPFGIPVMIAGNPDVYPLMVDLILEENVPVVLINGIDAAFFKIFKEAGRKILCRPLDVTPENAREAERLGADIIIATGFDEGGTLPSKTIGTFSVTSQIAHAVTIPVMSAGGITDVHGVRSVFALGAEGVYAGTLFLATLESRMADSVKKMVVNSSADDLLMFRSALSFYRSLPTPFAYKLVEMDKAGKSTEEITNVLVSNQGMRVGMVEGNLEEGYISVGNGITYIKEIRSVKAVINDVMQDFI